MDRSGLQRWPGTIFRRSAALLIPTSQATPVGMYRCCPEILEAGESTAPMANTLGTHASSRFALI